MLTRKIIYLFIFLFIQSSCSNKTNTDDYVERNFHVYAQEYKTINDSIIYYANCFLKEFTSEYMYKWELDSLVCINSNKNKLVTTINSSSGKCSECKMDDVTKIIGTKINNKWYFMKAGTLVVPRDMYGKDEMHPLTFHELSKIARKEMFGENCLIKKDGEYIVNDAWVEYFFYNNGMCAHCITKQQFDSTHWQAITDKWKHKIDTNEYKPLQRKQFKNTNL